MTPLHDTAVAMGYTTENNCVQSNDTVLDILNNEAIFLRLFSGAFTFMIFSSVN